MNKGQRSVDRMKSFVVGINQEKNESNSIQMAPESAIKGSIKFLMNRDGNNEFRNKTLLEKWIGFNASGSVYAVSWVLKVLKYNDKKSASSTGMTIWILLR